MDSKVRYEEASLNKTDRRATRPGAAPRCPAGAEVYQSNAEGALLVVSDRGARVFAHFYHDLAGADGERLRGDLGSLAEGADASEWDGNQLAELEPDIASMSLVADGCGAYPDGMGTDAMRFFGIER